MVTTSIMKRKGNNYYLYIPGQQTHIITIKIDPIPSPVLFASEFQFSLILAIIPLYPLLRGAHFIEFSREYRSNQSK